MSTILTPDICVIGAGSGGLTVAAGAAQMGASVVLVEKGKMGGDCLNYGCVPSKSLIAAAHAAHQAQTAQRFGISTGEIRVDMARVRDHLRAVIASIEPHDSVERFEGLGVNVIQGAARFTGKRQVEADGQIIKARRFVIAAGSRPATPPIEGLGEVPYYTNETIFDLAEVPRHLIVLGGGPIGVELGQAFRRLGAKVTIVESAERIFARADAELTEILRQRLTAEGIDLAEGWTAQKVRQEGDDIALTLNGSSNAAREVAGSHLLVAVGRKANIETLGLKDAGIDSDQRGIIVDSHLRTSDKHVFAIGDIAAGLPKFTHVAGWHGGIVLRQALFRLPARADHDLVPAAIYTDPEFAWVGLDETEAKYRHGDFRTLRWKFLDNDRARAEGATGGMVKVFTTKRGRVLGAAIVGPQAGELIQTWILAVSKKMNIRDVAQIVAPYPTLAEVNKRAAGSFFEQALFGDKTKRLVRFLSRFG